MRSDRYQAQVFWSDEDEGFIAIAPDLPGCSAFGETQNVALAELQNAIDAWVDAATAAGNPIPQPSRPEPQPQASGKVLLRIPRSLHATLIAVAKADGVSLNQMASSLLAGAVGRHFTAYASGLSPSPGGAYLMHQCLATTGFKMHAITRTITATTAPNHGPLLVWGNVGQVWPTTGGDIDEVEVIAREAAHG